MDKDTGGKGKPADSGDDGGDVRSNGASGAKYVSRPRGTSDAKWRLGRPGNDVSNSTFNLCQSAYFERDKNRVSEGFLESLAMN